jgi:hypothetical protein
MEKRFAWWSKGQRSHVNIESFGASHSEFQTLEKPDLFFKNFKI